MRLLVRGIARRGPFVRRVDEGRSCHVLVFPQLVLRRRAEGVAIASSAGLPCGPRGTALCPNRFTVPCLAGRRLVWRRRGEAPGRRAVSGSVWIKRVIFRRVISRGRECDHEVELRRDPRRSLRNRSARLPSKSESSTIRSVTLIRSATMSCVSLTFVRSSTRWNASTSAKSGTSASGGSPLFAASSSARFRAERRPGPTLHALKAPPPRACTSGTRGQLDQRFARIDFVFSRGLVFLLRGEGRSIFDLMWTGGGHDQVFRGELEMHELHHRQMLGVLLGDERPECPGR